MDTSRTYIKMCDISEIRGQKSKILKISNEFSISYQNKEILINHEGHFFFRGEIWLPRQDQIQEMMPPYDSSSSMAVMFGLFCDNKEMYEGIYAKKGHGFVQKFNSMEQLWLAFYMYEKHGKIWDSKEEKWVKG